MNLNNWAIKWGVPFEAVEDLRRGLQTVNTEPSPQFDESEGAIQTRVRLEASAKGARIWRNNVGAVLTEKSFIRYGLANDSKQMNDKIKSSDLIGIKPIRITESMVGGVIGQFLAREVKKGDWNFTGTKRELAQLAFLNLIISLGGDAAFTNREGTI